MPARDMASIYIHHHLKLRQFEAKVMPYADKVFSKSITHSQQHNSHIATLYGILYTNQGHLSLVFICEEFEFYTVTTHIWGHSLYFIRRQNTLLVQH